MITIALELFFVLSKVIMKTVFQLSRFIIKRIYKLLIIIYKKAKTGFNQENYSKTVRTNKIKVPIKEKNTQLETEETFIVRRQPREDLI